MSSEEPRLQPLQVLNLREHITQRISRAILDGTYAFGARLAESVIAEQLGVSRAPVREALSALEQDGIVTQVPRRGYFVVDFTNKDIEEVYSLRLLLEIAALHRVVPHISEQDVVEMQHIVDALGEAALAQEDPDAIVALDLSFHEEICRMADHSRLFSAWNSLRLQTQLLLGVTSKTHYEYPDQPRQLHQHILDAIRERDAKRAEAALTDHVVDAQRRAVEALKILNSSHTE